MQTGLTGYMCFTQPGHIAMVTLGERGMKGVGGGIRVQRGRCKEGDWDWDELLVLHKPSIQYLNLHPLQVLEDVEEV